MPIKRLNETPINRTPRFDRTDPASVSPIAPLTDSNKASVMACLHQIINMFPMSDVVKLVAKTLAAGHSVDGLWAILPYGSKAVWPPAAQGSTGRMGHDRPGYPQVGCFLLSPLPLPPLFLCTRQWLFRLQCLSARFVRHGASGR